MKIKYIIFSAILLLALVGCKKEMDVAASLSVVANAPGGEMSDGVLTVKQGTFITFNLSGNADYLTFWSGEPGHNYQYRERTQIPKEDISAKLKFGSFARYGYRVLGKYPEGYFRVYISTTFTGLVKNDKDADVQRVKNHEWIEITDKCDLPTTSAPSDAPTNFSEVDLDQYLGNKEVVLAFRYTPTPWPSEVQNDAGSMPRYALRELKVETISSDGQRREIPAGMMGLSPFDMNGIDNEDAYYDGTNINEERCTGKKWMTFRMKNVPSELVVQNGKAKIITPGETPDANVYMQPDAWLITQPFLINSCLPDTGKAIKTMTDQLSPYVFKYDEPGEYTVTFAATNYNYKYGSEVIRELKIKVIP